jgi:hypothetical protein
MGMLNRTVRARILRAMAVLAVGGSSYQLSGCAPAVRDELVGGLEATSQGVASALISAFFLSLQDGASSNGLSTIGG